MVVTIQSTPFHSIFLRSIVILRSHQRLGLPSGLFHLSFMTKIVYAFLIPPTLATCPTHLILLDIITVMIFGEAYKL